MHVTAQPRVGILIAREFCLVSCSIQFCVKTLYILQAEPRLRDRWAAGSFPIPFSAAMRLETRGHCDIHLL